MLSDQELLHILSQSADACAVYDTADLHIRFVNSAMLEIWGKDARVLGQTFAAALPELAEQPFTKLLQDAWESGEIYTATDTPATLLNNGELRTSYFDFTYQPMRDKEGRTCAILHTARDVTSRVLAWRQVSENNRAMREANENLSRLNVRLQESETDFKRLVEQAPVAILVFHGKDMVIDLANQAMLEILGKDHGILGKPLLEGLPEIKGAPAVDQLFHVFHTGESSDGMEEPVPIKRNGVLETRYFNFSYRPLWDNGKVIGVMDVAVEVTAQVLAREHAERQKRVYETITSGTPDLMYVWDLDYKFTYVNKALLTMWGKTWDTAIGKGLRENGYEEWHAQMHEREIDQVVATKQPVRGEVAFPHAVLGKRIYDYILIPVLNAQGEVEAVAGTTRDVSERKQMEEDLARSSEELQAINEEMAATNEEQAASNEELTATNRELAEVNQELRDARWKIEENEIALRLAIEAANFGTWFIHSVTREFITDARLKQLFGYYPDENLSIEQALTQITDDYRGFVSDKLEKAIYHGGDYDVTYPVTGLHDGQLRWLRAVGNLKADPSGTFDAFTGVVMDVTEQHMDEQRKNDFIGMVSHELKTPLTSLTAIVQIANSKLRNNDDSFLAGAMEKANFQVKRMANMINGFLNISRLESAKLLIDKKDFDLDGLISEVIRETELTVTSHQISYQGCGVLPVCADQDKISSVITNLLSNAIKYSPSGTTITIACATTDDQVRISVRDEGIGLTEADSKKVFDRYFRVQDNQTRHISGFGIGLYLSAEIIKRHDGQIWVESEPGKGAAFCFTLPRS